MCQEEKEEGDSFPFRTRSILGHRNNKNSKERTFIAGGHNIYKIQEQMVQPKLGNRHGKKNNCMDISSEKLVRLYSRKPAYGEEREI